MAGVDFTIRLVDQLTGPAKAARASTEQMSSAIVKAARSAAELASSELSAANATMAAARASGNYGQILGAQVAQQRAAQNAAATMNRQYAAQAQAVRSVEQATRKAAQADHAWQTGKQQFGGGKGQFAIRGKLAEIQNNRIQQQMDAYNAKVASVSAAKAGGPAGLKEEMFGAVTGATLMAGAIQKAIGFAMELARAIAGLAISFAKAAVSSAMFLSQQKAGYAMVMGSAAAGAKELEWARKAAVQYGLDVEETIVSYRQLLGMKMGTEFSQNMIKMVADMKGLGASSEDVSSALRQMNQMLGKGKASAEELNVIFEALPMLRGGMIDALAKNLKIPMADVIKMLGTGEIKAADALKAMQDAVVAAGGGKKLGDVAAKNAATLAGSWDKVKSKIQDVGLSIGAKLLPILEQKLMPLFEKFGAWFDSAEGSKFIDGLVEGLTSLVDMVAGLGKSLSAADVTSFLMGLVTIVNGVAKAFVWLAENASVVKFVLGSIAVVAGVVAAAIAALGAAFSVIAYPVYIICDGLSALWTLLKMLWEWITGVFSGITGAISGALTGISDAISGAISGIASALGSAAQSIGAAISSGLIGGIMGGASGVISSIVDMCMGGIKAGKAALGIASPSKLFAGIGENVAYGMAQGIDAGQPAVASSAAGMLDPKRYGSGGGARTTNVSAPSKIHISIPAAADPQATAAAVYATLETKLAGIFQDVALQVSVAGAP